jgi:hypothetical protein
VVPSTPYARGIRGYAHLDASLADKVRKLIINYDLAYERYLMLLSSGSQATSHGSGDRNRDELYSIITESIRLITNMEMAPLDLTLKWYRLVDAFVTLSSGSLYQTSLAQGLGILKERVNKFTSLDLLPFYLRERAIYHILHKIRDWLMSHTDASVKVPDDVVALCRHLGVMELPTKNLFHYYQELAKQVLKREGVVGEEQIEASIERIESMLFADQSENVDVSVDEFIKERFNFAQMLVGTTDTGDTAQGRVYSALAALRDVAVYQGELSDIEEFARIFGKAIFKADSSFFQERSESPWLYGSQIDAMILDIINMFDASSQEKLNGTLNNSLSTGTKRRLRDGTRFSTKYNQYFITISGSRGNTTMSDEYIHSMVLPGFNLRGYRVKDVAPEEMYETYAGLFDIRKSAAGRTSSPVLPDNLRSWAEPRFGSSESSVKKTATKNPYPLSGNAKHIHDADLLVAIDRVIGSRQSTSLWKDYEALLGAVSGAGGERREVFFAKAAARLRTLIRLVEYQYRSYIERTDVITQLHDAIYTSIKEIETGITGLIKVADKTTQNFLHPDQKERIRLALFNLLADFQYTRMHLTAFDGSDKKNPLSASLLETVDKKLKKLAYDVGSVRQLAPASSDSKIISYFEAIKRMWKPERKVKELLRNKRTVAESLSAMASLEHFIRLYGNRIASLELVREVRELIHNMFESVEDRLRLVKARTPSDPDIQIALGALVGHLMQEQKSEFMEKLDKAYSGNIANLWKDDLDDRQKKYYDFYQSYKSQFVDPYNESTTNNPATWAEYLEKVFIPRVSILPKEYAAPFVVWNSKQIGELAKSSLGELRSLDGYDRGLLKLDLSEFENLNKIWFKGGHSIDFDVEPYHLIRELHLLLQKLEENKIEFGPQIFSLGNFVLARVFSRLKIKAASSGKLKGSRLERDNLLEHIVVVVSTLYRKDQKFGLGELPRQLRAVARNYIREVEGFKATLAQAAFAFIDANKEYDEDDSEEEAPVDL